MIIKIGLVFLICEWWIICLFYFPEYIQSNFRKWTL